VTTPSKSFVHLPLDEEIQAIGGYYASVKEVRLPYENREILYVVGYAVVDSSCCGVGGCGYAKVPGFLLDWRARYEKRGQPISQVEPITDRETKKAVRRIIAREEGIRESMVDFE
jgi:hypothetical protein